MIGCKCGIGHILETSLNLNSKNGKGREFMMQKEPPAAIAVYATPLR